MSTTTTTTPDDDDGRVRPFADALREINAGRSHDELSLALRDLTAAVKETGRKGTLTYTVAIAPMKGNPDVLQVTDRIVAKVPESDRKASIFFADAAGNLTRTDPQQLSFESLREVPTPTAETTTLKEIAK